MSVRTATRLRDETGATTIEYTMLFGFMGMISVLATTWLINVLRDMLAVLTVNIALFLTGVPTPSP